MITTEIVPTTTLGAGSRLLLKIKGAPHAFSEPQLTQAVIGYTRDMESYVACYGMPRQWGPDRQSVAYLPPGDEADEDELRSFNEATEWLLYVGRATRGPGGLVMLTGQPL